MAKLTRWTMPVFAGSAAQDETSVFGTMKTSPEYTSDVAAAIDTQAYNKGWTDAVEIGYAPFLEDMNSLQRAITYQISYNQQQGIPEWASDTEYYKGSVVKLNTASGMQIYSSLVDNNVGNLVSDNTKWKLLIDSANSYVTTNTTQTISGVKTFTNNMTTDNILPKGDITLGTSTNTWGKQLQFRDTTGKRIARIQPMAIDTTNNRVGMWVNNADNTVEKGIYVDSNGTTSAPTPSAGDNSTKIATTAFVQTAVNTRATQADINLAISNVLASLYPVGSIYIGTQSTCPLATLISGSQWQLVAQDRALWGGNGSNANSWINAGLPNITGSFASGCLMNWQDSQYWGALYRGTQSSYPQNAGGTDGGTNATIAFNAASSNSIYGSSSTVQPPAYRVNVWRRTA